MKRNNKKKREKKKKNKQIRRERNASKTEPLCLFPFLSLIHHKNPFLSLSFVHWIISV